MTFQIKVQIQHVDHDSMTVHVTRWPNQTTNRMVVAGMVASELREEYGWDWPDAMAKLAPLATTEGSTWKDRVSKVDLIITPECLMQEWTIRFWKESNAVFQKQPDGSYIARLSDLTGK